MWIEEKLSILYRRITGSEKATFTGCFIGGLVAHLYIYTNTIPNFDGISRMYDGQEMTISGRWFLHYASSLNYYTQMPMVIGVLAMLFLAASAMLMIHMFRIESCVMAGLWGGILAVFPAIADTNTYIYTASSYCLAISLATLGVWLTKKIKWGIISGSALLALSMGIYQTYVTVAITLSVLLVIQELLNSESRIRSIFNSGLKYVVYICLGTGLYYVILKLFLKVKGIALWSYLGMSNVENGYPIEKIGSTICKTYAGVGRFFFRGEDGFNNIFIVCNVIVAILSVALVIEVIKKQEVWKDRIKIFGLVILLALIPVSVNFTQIISPYSKPRLIMKFSFVFIYFIPIILIELIKKNSHVKIQIQAAVTAIVGAFFVLAVYFWQYDNLLYTMLNQAHRATLSFVTNVVSRIEGCEGYHMGMQVIIVGGFPSDRYDSDISVYEEVKHESALSSSVIPLNKHIYYYMNDWLNVRIEEPPEEVFIHISETEEFKEMSLYPDDGSIKIIGNNVVVKMQELYIPKSLFEKEYEERR